MDNVLREMGVRIYERRKQMRLTQDQLAERAGVTAQTISTAELGKKALRPENIIKIALAMEVSTDYLLLGRIASEDADLLATAASNLSPKQYRCLEEIVKTFIDAIESNQDQ